MRPDYFATLGIRLLEGRTFTADEARAGGVLLVNEAAARHFWPDGDALGGEVKWGRDWSTVIGITDNVISGGPTRSRDEPKFYLPFKHEAQPLGAGPAEHGADRACGGRRRGGDRFVYAPRRGSSTPRSRSRTS